MTAERSRLEALVERWRADATKTIARPFDNESLVAEAEQIAEAGIFTICADELAAILAEPNDEVAALRHDLEQYQARQSDMLGEMEQLRAALDDITRGGPTVDAVLRGEWESVAEWMRGRAEAALQAQRGE